MAYFPLVLSLVMFLCFASPSSSDFSPAEPLLQPDVDGLSVSAPSPPATTGGSSVSVVVGSGGDRGDQRAAGRALESFPAVANSTVMFLHVFKVCHELYTSYPIIIVEGERAARCFNPTYSDKYMPSFACTYHNRSQVTLSIGKSLNCKLLYVRHAGMYISYLVPTSDF